ncbi:unnamed protein product [Larinioides sclopetarius]|uniref:Ion transport domain-containing protein n=1 Tax=Larinioides sclopetarius TaxID=280406 RepID=A0AAV2AKK4_9ARAC
MYVYSGNSLISAPWQATDPNIICNLRCALQLIANTSDVSYQQAPKKLTTEAVYMIFVLLAFAILTLIGNLLDIYGYLQRAPTKKKLSEELQERVSKKEVPCLQDGKKSSEITVWKKSCKLFLSCFSILKNGKNLLSTDSDENHISCLDGIRVICVYMIIQAHITAFYPRVLNAGDMMLLLGNTDIMHRH